jgi:hypothetical protein
MEPVTEDQRKEFDRIVSGAHLRGELMGALQRYMRSNAD